MLLLELLENDLQCTILTFGPTVLFQLFLSMLLETAPQNCGKNHYSVIHHFEGLGYPRNNASSK